MSRSDSGSEAESERSASASVAQPNLEALRGLESARLIDGPEWFGGDLGFHPSFAARQYRFPNVDVNSVSPSRKNPASNTSSMAVTQYSGSTYPSNFGSQYVPSLDGSVETAKSGSSIRTSRADSVVQQAVLEEDESGALRPPRPYLECPYKFLGCDLAFGDWGQWDLHCQSHFHTRLPTTVECPFACNWSTTEATGEDAWRQKQVHIINSHSASERVASDKRPSHALILHLRNVGIINVAQQKELRLTGRLGNTVFLQSGGSTREQRRERNGPRGPPRGPPTPRW